MGVLLLLLVHQQYVKIVVVSIIAFTVGPYFCIFYFLLAAAGASCRKQGGRLMCLTRVINKRPAARLGFLS